MSSPLFNAKNFDTKCQLQFHFKYDRPMQCLCSLFCAEWTSKDLFSAIHFADQVALPNHQSTLNDLFEHGKLDWIFR